MRLIILFLLISLNAWSMTCDDETGIDLSKNDGPYARMTPTNQGRIGTCYAHSAANLLRSHYKLRFKPSILEAMAVSESAADGGHTDDVLQGFADRRSPCMRGGKLYVDDNGEPIYSPWICTSLKTRLNNLFPKKTKNIVTDITDVMIETPVHYTYRESYRGEKYKARTEAIIDHMKKILRGEAKSCKVYEPIKKKKEEWDRLIKEFNEIAAKVDEVRERKNYALTDLIYSVTGWKETNDVHDAEIKRIREEELNPKRKEKTEASKEYFDLKKMAKKYRYNPDLTTVEKAAEVMLHHNQIAYNKIQLILRRYGIDPNMMGTIEDFMTERVTAPEDPNGTPYHGAHYVYSILKKVVETGCPQADRMCLLPPYEVKKLEFKKLSDAEKNQSVTQQLEKSKGVSIYLKANVLSSNSTELHAVNIIGCRKVMIHRKPTYQYLIHNSWGTSCANYKKSLQGRCKNGRVWVDAPTLMTFSEEIQWIE